MADVLKSDEVEQYGKQINHALKGRQHFVNKIVLYFYIRCTYVNTFLSCSSIDALSLRVGKLPEQF